MRTLLIKSGFGLILAWLTWSTAACLAQSGRQQAPPLKAQESLKEFLQRYLTLPSLDADKTTRYFDALVDLNGDGVSEAIVYVTGQRWCGSGGCMTLILVRNDSASYSIVSKILITRPPIRVFNKASNGWRNIGVWVQGGGIQPGYEAELRFDGKTYPTNPSIPSARRLTENVGAEVAVPSSPAGTLLYP